MLTFLLTGSAALLSYYQCTETLDHVLYDTVQQFSHLTPANDLLIIDIDEKSINALGRWPWSRDTHAKMLNQLSKAKTAAVVFDVLFSDQDKTNPSADQLFAQAIANHGHVVLPLFIKQTDLHGQVLEVPPAPLFYQAAHSVGHVHVAHHRDGVVRSVFLKEGVGSAYWPHISLALWQLLEGDQPLPGSQANLNTLVDNPHMITRDYLNYLPMPGPKQGLLHLSYIDVLNGNVDLQRLHNKTLFIGAVAAGLGDTLTTSVGSLSGVELNAWIFHALRSQAFIQETSHYSTVLSNTLLVLLLLLLLGRLSPRAFLASSLCAISGLVIANALLQLLFQRWLPVIPAITAIITFYPLWSWRRLEVALDFLRKELHDINHQNTDVQGEMAINQQEINPEGTELITQTIAQLVAVKQHASTNRRLMQQSLAQLQDAVVISNLHNRIMFANKAFHQLTNANTSTDLIEALAPITLNNHLYWSEMLQQLQQTQTPFATQAIHSTLEKNIFCQGSLANIGGSENDTIIVVLTDISQLKAAEKARLEALNFLSHDLRSPMVSVLAIIERQRATNAIAPSVLNPIEVLVRKNLNYADDFLQLSRAESLQASQLHLCDLHSVFDCAQVHAMALTESKNIQLVTRRIDDDAWVMGDDDLLERAVINLLSNAVKYSPADSTITLSLECKDGHYLLRVSDQGCGIAKKELPSLFERYTRSSNHQGIMGAGLGLNFVAIVTRRHQGSIHVESIPGQGSVFTLSLKAVSAAINIE